MIDLSFQGRLADDQRVASHHRGQVNVLPSVRSTNAPPCTAPRGRAVAHERLLCSRTKHRPVRRSLESDSGEYQQHLYRTR